MAALGSMTRLRAHRQAIASEQGSSATDLREVRTMEIRDIAPTELDALLELYHHLHDDDDPLPSRDVVEAVWREIHASPRLACFGGFVDRVLVASCTLTVVPSLTRGCRPYGVIENVVTHAAHRRRGHGRALLAHALEHAWSRGCYKVMLLTGRKDEATLRFYAGAGFDPHGKRAFVARPGPGAR